MRLHSLQLINFRNYKERTWEFGPDSVVLYGPNGIGKTNILEAVYVATVGRSYRTTETADLIRFGAEEAGIILQFTKKDTPQKITIRLAAKGRKEIRLNGNALSQRELIGTLNTVLFCPEDLQLIKGSPQQRRRFIDMEISQTSATYYHQLSLYNRALQQRNRLLKEYAGQRSVPLLEWDEQLATGAAYLVKKRLESIKKLNLLIDLMNRRLTGGKENLQLRYEQPYSAQGPVTEKDAFLQLLQESLPRDRARFTTSVGPHRDDLGFFAGPVDLKKYGSQGQQRTAVLSLKLSELEFIKSEVGEYPLLLLDDVLSELDKERRANLLHFIHNRVQTFITTTDSEDMNALSPAMLIACREEVTADD